MHDRIARRLIKQRDSCDLRLNARLAAAKQDLCERNHVRTDLRCPELHAGSKRVNLAARFRGHAAERLGFAQIRTAYLTDDRKHVGDMSGDVDVEALLMPSPSDRK